MFRKKKETLLGATIENALKDLNHHAVGSEDYVKTLEMIERLTKVKESQTPSPVSRDTLASVGANLLGILMIIKHESVNVIASKALGFVIKTKV